MRCLSAGAIKKMRRGIQSPQRTAPEEGTRIREVYDLLKSRPGEAVHLKLNGRRKYGRLLYDLQDYWGLDIRYLGLDINNRPEHMLVGEWFGKVYVDYVAERMQQKEKDMNKPVPDGVHTLSPESVEALKRAAEKGAATTAKHTKRGS